MATTRCVEIDGRNHALGPRFQPQALRRADARTPRRSPDTASRRVWPGALVGLLRIIRRDQRHRFDRAGIDTFAAAVA